jgi:hypothetical protein
MVQITKLLIVSFTASPCYFSPLKSKYSLQHPVLKHPHFLAMLMLRDRNADSCKATDKLQLSAVAANSDKEALCKLTELLEPCFLSINLTLKMGAVPSIEM